MQDTIKILLKEFFRFISYGIITIVLLLLMFGITHFDIAVYENIPEFSFTEIIQEVLLLCCTGIFSFLAHKYTKNGLWLVAGFLCCMLIRELDIVFDMIFHGAWKLIALPVAIFFIFLAFKKGISPAVADLSHFIQKKSYPFIFLSLILILIVSRMLGSMELIKLVAVYDDAYQFLMKNFMEEGVELIGYVILFVSSCCYFSEYHRESTEK